MPSSSPSPRQGPFDLRGLFALVVVVATVSAVAAGMNGDIAVLVASIVLGGASLFRLLSPPPPTTTSVIVDLITRTAVNLMVFAVALATAALVAEGIARWVYRDVTTTAAFRGYFTRQWLRTEVRTNHYDFRGAEFEEVQAPGIYRVAVMGDSFTFGNGIPEEARFSNRVGEAVRGRGIEVLNFGFPGHNWDDHVKTLERRILRLRPAFVLLQWGINDVELDRDVNRRPAIPSLLPHAPLHGWLSDNSAFYTIMNAQWNRFQVRRQVGESYTGYLTRLYSDPNSEGAVHAEAQMRRFVELCRKRGAGVGILLFPDAAESLGDGYPFRFLHDRLLEDCKKEGIECVDLLPRLAQVEDRFTLWASPLDAHPSSLANQIAAEEILATFARSWGFDHSGVR
jgi:hypothetical protein